MIMPRITLALMLQGCQMGVKWNKPTCYKDTLIGFLPVERGKVCHLRFIQGVLLPISSHTLLSFPL